MADIADNLDDGAELARRMRRHYPVLLRQAFADASAQLAIDIVFNLANPYVAATIASLAEQITNVSATTKQEIRDLLAVSTAEGWSTETLAAALRQHQVTASKSRAETIARTETARGHSLGAKLAWGESGVVEGMQWLVTEPCEICAPLTDKIVALHEDFAPGISEPPAHPNCRCALSPVVQKESSTR